MARRPLPVTILLALGPLVSAACGDGPSAPDRAGSPAAAAVHEGDLQEAVVREVVASPPTLRVTDAAGAPVPGVRVSFAVVEGGGSLAVTDTVTDAGGVASARSWRLGPRTGENVVEAVAGRLPAVRFHATARSPFRIDVRYVGTVGAAERAAVEAAALRWESVVVADLPDVHMAVPAGACFETQPALDETVDDLLLIVEVMAIDGVGKVLGEAGPCYLRSRSDLPIVGVLRLDEADLTALGANGALGDVVLHEVGHVLGIGSLWPRHALLSGARSSDPRFLGARGAAAYRELGGGGSTVPVENTGGEGTRDSHWRESVFRGELMTGYLSAAPNPLSALTIASLEDLGYGVDRLEAAAYVLGATFQGVAPAFSLEGHERALEPRYTTDEQGRHQRIP